MKKCGKRRSIRIRICICPFPLRSEVNFQSSPIQQGLSIVKRVLKEVKRNKNMPLNKKKEKNVQSNRKMCQPKILRISNFFF